MSGFANQNGDECPQPSYNFQYNFKFCDIRRNSHMNQP